MNSLIDNKTGKPNLTAIRRYAEEHGISIGESKALARGQCRKCGGSQQKFVKRDIEKGNLPHSIRVEGNQTIFTYRLSAGRHKELCLCIPPQKEVKTNG